MAYAGGGIHPGAPPAAVSKETPVQNPADPDDIRCDGCQEPVHPMDRHVQLPICTLYGGQIGLPVIFCKKCGVAKLGLNPEIFVVG